VSNSKLSLQVNSEESKGFSFESRYLGILYWEVLIIEITGLIGIPSLFRPSFLNDVILNIQFCCFKYLIF